MRKPVCLKLAWETLIHNSKITVPFLFGSVVMAALLYSVMALSQNPGLMDTFGGQNLKMFIQLGSWIVMLFTCIFFFYLNAVLIRSRKNELGLFTVLGMEKRHLVRIILYQLLMLYAANLVIGIPVGLLADKGMMLLCAKLLGLQTPIGFYISWDAIRGTIITLGIIYLMMFVWSAWMTAKTNPLDLLKGKNQGEMEPKNRWIIGVAGLVCLGIGYWIALSVGNPIQAMMLFFVAVAFVIAGTYLTFMYGSIMILKVLQANRHYYYRPNHFISVSNMKYRMKENAASLASIAILSTSVLVAMCSTTMMLVSSDQNVRNQYPMDFRIRLYNVPAGISEQVLDAAEQGTMNTSVSAVQTEGYAYFSMMGKSESNAYATKDGFESANSMLLFVPLEDYNRILGTDLQLAEGQVAGSIPDMKDASEFVIDGTALPFVYSDAASDVFFDQNMKSNPYGMPLYVIAVSSMEQVMNELGMRSLVDITIQGTLNENAREVIRQIAASSGDESDPVSDELSAAVDQSIASTGLNMEESHIGGLSFYETDKALMGSMFGGLFFIGLYVSLMFLFAVILIMYYKQITEGTADRSRFKILQNVGLETRQIRRIINDQVLIIFFLPLVMAAVHMAFAYPILTKLLNSLGAFDKTLFITLIAIMFAVYTLVYIVVYRLSARTYYSIVRDDRQ